MTLQQIADALGCACPAGYGSVPVDRVADPSNSDSRSLVFLSNPRYEPQVRACDCAAVIVKNGCTLDGKVCLEVDDPYLGYARAAVLFEDASPLFGAGVHAAAWVSASARVHESCAIGPCSVVGDGCVVGARTVIDAHCVIENGARIGEDCRIHSGAIVCRGVTIGNRVIVECGAVIGSEGFGNARDALGHWHRIPSFGTVVVHDDAWIGANTAIDRGTLNSTVIARGARLDNLIQIAHNVVVGEDTAIAAQTGIAGSTVTGKRVYIGGQAGFAGHISIGDDAFVGAQAGVSNHVTAGERLSGSPARDLMKYMRINAALAELPSMVKELKRLRAEVDSLTKGS